MDELSAVGGATATNSSGSSSGSSWWRSSTIIGDTETTELTLPLDGSEGGLFSGNFVPPPPRPIFLDETATPDGLTTCDLCSWAWQNGGNAFNLDTTLEAPGELGWVLTLVIVSFVSAVLGAIVMIVVLHCKRLKSNGTNPQSERPPIRTPDTDKEISTITQSYPNVPPNDRHHLPLNHHHHHQAINNNGVWSWLSRKSATNQSQLDSRTSPAENHYTHMDEYNVGSGGVVVAGDEALYAELDRESQTGGNSSPAYQNGAYTDPDQPTSAPSSAYYSDLSVTATTVPDRAYEVVGLSTLPVWSNESTRSNNNGDEAIGSNKRPARLAAISETVSVPSNYV